MVFALLCVLLREEKERRKRREGEREKNGCFFFVLSFLSIVPLPQPPHNLCSVLSLSLSLSLYTRSFDTLSFLLVQAVVFPVPFSFSFLFLSLLRCAFT
jgi:hypothetical protein